MQLEIFSLTGLYENRIYIPRLQMQYLYCVLLSWYMSQVFSIVFQNSSIRFWVRNLSLVLKKCNYNELHCSPLLQLLYIQVQPQVGSTSTRGFRIGPRSWRHFPFILTFVSIKWWHIIKISAGEWRSTIGCSGRVIVVRGGDLAVR